MTEQAQQEQKSQNQSVIAGKPNEGSNREQENSFNIPEPYKGKGWVEKIKSPDDLWKALDGAQSLIGKRPAGIPANDAPDEEWEKFYAAAGRPENPDAYTLSDIEGVDISEAKKEAAGILHAAGLNTKQAAKVWDMYLQSVQKDAASMKEKQVALDKEFDDLSTKIFGDKFEEKSKVAQEMIKSLVPKELIPSYEALADHPQALAAVIVALNGAKEQIDKVKQEYGAEGSIAGSGGAQPNDILQTRQELARLRNSREAIDPTNMRYKETLARIEELDGIVTRSFKK